MSRNRALPAGSVVAGYTVDRPLGRGGMAVVYRALHSERAQPVALKVLDPKAWDGDALDGMHREARIAAAVAHRHILPVYESGEHAGQPFIAMQLECGDLRGLLWREGRLRAWRAIALLTEIASALDAAHAHGLVHRDIKPSNVLLGEEEDRERALVADFGVARLAFSGGEPNGSMVGTVGYASPEQIRGELVDRRADVYGLGCLLYECLTGREPFLRSDTLTTMWAHLHDDPPAPSVLVPELPAALDPVVARALAKDPRSRFGSAGALAEAALEATAGRRPTRATLSETRELPTGKVTFLFTDIEGSTRLLHDLGETAYAAELEEHRRIIRDACGAEGGVEVDTQGDAFFFAFSSATQALAGAAVAQEALARTSFRVRMGIHTGTPHRTTEGYVGVDVHRAARIAHAAHGGQVVVSSAAAALLEGSELRSLGGHRLKDFDEPVTLFQLGQDSFPPLKTIANTNLPTPATSFFGREKELHDAALLLRSARVLTVHGPGGQGKTRFALELARRAREERFSDYEDGVFSCFLAPLRDPELVPSSIAHALSVAEQPGRSAVQALVEHLRDRKVLLLLDNLEHVLASVPDLAELVSSCSGLTLLLTSREVLRLQGEVPYELPPLSLDEGVVLFCERARIEPSDTVRALCDRLDGLPLAIELAAARTRLLLPEQLLERLSHRLDLLKGGRDADARQQTLRATIQWSYDLLSPQEQALIARLSVFAGGFTLGAAEEVCDADLDSLESLLDKSLLRRIEGRLWILETIREFAAERLEEEAHTEAVRSRHAQYFASLARTMEPELLGPDGASAVARLELELDNLRAALGHSLEADREEALQMATDLGFFWHWRGRNDEGGAWLDAALSDDEVGSPSLRARALNRASVFAVERGEHTRGHELNECSLALARLAGDREAETTALHDLAGSYGRLGLLRKSVARYLEALKLFDELGDEAGAVIALANMGVAHRRLGELDRARSCHREAVRRARKLGNHHYLALSLCELGISELENANGIEAGRLLREALRVTHDTGGLALVPWIVWSLAVEASREGSYARAAQLAGVAERCMRVAGSEFESDDAAWVGKALDRARTEIGEDAFDRAREQGEALSMEDAVSCALEEIDLPTAEAKA